MKIKFLLLFLFFFVGSLQLLKAQDCPDGTQPPTPPTFSISNPNPCDGETVNFNVTSSTNGLTFNWSFGETGTSANQAFNIGNMNGNTITVTLTATDVNNPNCKSSTNQTINIQPYAALFSSPAGFTNCTGGSYNLTVFDKSIGNNITNYQIDWGDGSSSFNSNTFPTTTGVSHTYNTAGVFTLTYTITNNNGCISTTKQVVTNITNPAVGAGTTGSTTTCGPVELCFEINTTESNDASTMYEVDFGDGSDIEILNHPPPSTVCHTYSNSSCEVTGDEFTFSVRAINNCAESIATIAPIIIGLPPTAGFEPNPNPACVGESIRFDNTTIEGYDTNCNNATNYFWNFGDGSATPPTDSNSDMFHEYTQAGSYTVSLRAENICGDDIFTQTICVTDPITVDFNINQNSGCPGLTITPDNLSSQLSCGGGAAIYDWNVSPSSGVTISDDEAAEPTIQFNSSGTFTLELRVPGNCGGTDTETITINTNPNPNIAPIQDVCANFELDLEPGDFQLNGDYQSVQWNFSGGSPPSFIGENPPPISYNTPNTYTVEVILDGCIEVIDSQTFTFYDTQGETYESETICSLDDLFVLQPNTGTWSGEGVSNNRFDPSIGEGSYVLTQTVSIGGGACDIENTKVIEVRDSPTVDAGSNQTICVENGVITLAPITQGTWQVANGLDIATGQFNPETVGEGTYTLTYSYTDPTTQCSNSDQITIEVFDIQINLDNIETNYCNIDQDYNLNANVNVSTTGQWSSPQNSVSTDGTFNPTLITIDPDTNSGTDILTYTVTHQGCTDSQQITVTVIVAEEISAGEDVSVCPDAPPIALNDGFPSGGTWLLNGNPITTFTPSANNVGANQLTYLVGSGNCEQTDIRIIEVFAVANISLNAPSPICLNESPHQFSATPTGGTWSGDFISSNGSFDPSNAGAGSYEVTYTFTDDKGCTFTQSKTIVVEGIPTFDAPIISEACVGDEVAFVLEGENLSCTWTFEDGMILNGCNQSRSFDSEATYSVTLEVSTQLGCKDELTQNIFIASPPMANFTEDAPDEFVCTPLPVNIQNMSEGYNAIYTFDFGNGESLTTSNADTVFTYTYEGAYIVSDTTFFLTLTVENPCGTEIFAEEINVKPSPQIKFGPKENEVCSGTPLEFNNDTEGNPDTFLWNFGDGTTSTAFIPEPHAFFTGENDTTYTITLIASNECNTDTMSWEILIKPNTVKSFFNTHPTEGCAPLTVQFENISTDASNILFNFDGENVSNADNPTHIFEEAGIYEVLLAADNGCAFDSSYQTIEVFPAPQIEGFDMPTVACVNEHTSFGAIVTEDISSYLWRFGDGDSSTLTNPMHAYSEVGTYEVSLTIVSSFNECPNTFTIPMEIVEKPIAGIEAVDAFGCSPLTVDFQNVSQNGIAYQWSMGDGGAYVEFAPEHTFTSTVDTTFIVTLVAINSAGCRDSTQFLVPITAQPTAAFVASEYSHCDAPVVIDLMNESDGGTSYEWWINGTLEEVTEDASILLSDIDDYLIELVVTNPFGCSDTAETVIRVVPQAVAELPEDSFTACEGQFLTFPNGSTGTHFLWDLGDGTTSTLQNPSHVYALEGRYDLSLIASFDGLCPDTLELNSVVTVSRSPLADFTYVNVDDPIPTGTVQFSNSSQDAIYYFWDFGDTETSEEEDPIHRYDYFGNKLVTLIAENDIGCQDTARLEIELTFFKGLHVPNAFTPDLGPPDVREFLPKGVNLGSMKSAFTTNGMDWCLFLRS